MATTVKDYAESCKISLDEILKCCDDSGNLGMTRGTPKAEHAVLAALQEIDALLSSMRDLVKPGSESSG